MERCSGRPRPASRQYSPGEKKWESLPSVGTSLQTSSAAVAVSSPAHPTDQLLINSSTDHCVVNRPGRERKLRTALCSLNKPGGSQPLGEAHGPTQQHAAWPGQGVTGQGTQPALEKLKASSESEGWSSPASRSLEKGHGSSGWALSRCQHPS